MWVVLEFLNVSCRLSNSVFNLKRHLKRRRRKVLRDVLRLVFSLLTCPYGATRVPSTKNSLLGTPRGRESPLGVSSIPTAVTRQSGIGRRKPLKPNVTFRGTLVTMIFRGCPCRPVLAREGFSRWSRDPPSGPYLTLDRPPSPSPPSLVPSVPGPRLRPNF